MIPCIAPRVSQASPARFCRQPKAKMTRAYINRGGLLNPPHCADGAFCLMAKEQAGGLLFIRHSPGRDGVLRSAIYGPRQLRNAFKQLRAFRACLRRRVAFTANETSMRLICRVARRIRDPSNEPDFILNFKLKNRGRPGGGFRVRACGKGCDSVGRHAHTRDSHLFRAH